MPRHQGVRSRPQVAGGGGGGGAGGRCGGGGGCGGGGDCGHDAVLQGTVGRMLKFMLETERAATREDKAVVVSRTQERVVRHLLSADSRVERVT